MKSTAIIIFTLLATLFITPSFADVFFVETPKVIGGSDDLKKVVRELISQSLEEKGHEISSSAKDVRIRSSVMKLKDSYIVTIRLKRKGKLNSKKLKTKDLNDIDITISRLIKAVLYSKSVDSTINVKEITAEEQDRKSRKIKVAKQWLFGFGPSKLSSSIGSSSAISFSMGYAWSLDYDFDLILKYDFSNAEGASSSDINLFAFSGNYFFTDANYSPYLSADFGYGSAEDDHDNDVSSWGYALGGGVKFFRASSVNFAVEAKYAALVSSINGSAPSQMYLKFLIFF